MQWKDSSPVPHPKGGYIAGTDGKRYLLAGGGYWENDVKKWSRGAHWYDPETDRWSPAAELPEERGDAACVSYKGVIYSFGGGSNNVVNADALELRNGVWHKRPEWNLPAPRLYAVGAQLGNRAYVLGGIEKAGDYTNIADTVWSRDLDDARGQWKQHAPIPGIHRGHFALAAAKGRLYLFGGFGNVGAGLGNLDDAYSFDASKDAWTALPKIPNGTRAWWAVGHQERVLLLGGYTSTFATEVYSFDISTGRYELAGHLPHGLADAKYFQVGKWLVTAGGESGMKIRGPWTFRALLEGK